MSTCVKCDANLSSQSDGSTITCDIAHHGERVYEALTKLVEIVADTQLGTASYLRLVVGSGLIRDEVNAMLATYLFRKEIKAYKQDGNNAGAILIHIK